MSFQQQNMGDCALPLKSTFLIIYIFLNIWGSWCWSWHYSSQRDLFLSHYSQLWLKGCVIEQWSSYWINMSTGFRCHPAIYCHRGVFLLSLSTADVIQAGQKYAPRRVLSTVRRQCLMWQMDFEEENRGGWHRTHDNSPTWTSLQAESCSNVYRWQRNK